MSAEALASLASSPARATLSSLHIDTGGAQLFALRDLAPLLGAPGAQQQSLALEVALPGLPSWQVALRMEAGEAVRLLEVMLRQQLVSAGLEALQCSARLCGEGQQAVGTCFFPSGHELCAHLRLD